MPITNTLKSAEDFRRVGFTEDQSNMLASKLEETAQAQSEDLKQFIRQELGVFRSDLDAQFEGIKSEFRSFRAEMSAHFEGIRAEMDTKFDGMRAEMDVKFEGVKTEFQTVRAEIQSVRAEIHDVARDQLMKFVTVVVAVVSIAVAIIKLFPNLG